MLFGGDLGGFVSSLSPLMTIKVRERKKRQPGTEHSITLARHLGRGSLVSSSQAGPTCTRAPAGLCSHLPSAPSFSQRRGTASQQAGAERGGCRSPGAHMSIQRAERGSTAPWASPWLHPQCALPAENTLQEGGTREYGKCSHNLGSTGLATIWVQGAQPL